MKKFKEEEYNQVVTSMISKKKSFVHSIGLKKKEKKYRQYMQSQGENVNLEGTSTKSAALILSIGLLIHNIFEGMSIGLTSENADLIILLIAVCAHKTITAFSLGLAFMQAEWADGSALAIMVVFIFAGPAGTTLGFILSAEASAVVQAVFMAITSGTFL